MKLRFLGTGTSFGVPVVGCGCRVCTSDDPRNRRTRHGLLLESEGRRLLVDTPPELREQLVAAAVEEVDGVFLSHPHADHLHGLDDLRIFSLRSGRAVPLHVAEEHVAVLRRRFAYIWDRREEAPGTTLPDLRVEPFGAGAEIRPGGIPLTPLAFPHGGVRSYGFRAGPLGVVVDASEIPDEARKVLEGVRVLVVNALWFGDPHPTHFNVEAAVEVAESLGAERAYLTHLTHRLDYRETVDRLPDGILPAYDGLEVTL